MEVRCWAVAEDMNENFHGEARYESALVHPLAKTRDQSFGVRKLTIQRVVSLRVPNVECVRLNRDVLPKHRAQTKFVRPGQRMSAGRTLVTLIRRELSIML
jgi:hypothetical protein